MLPWQPRDSQQRNGAYHPTSGASSLHSHHCCHLTSCVIKRSQIVINYEVCFFYSKFGQARITLRMSEKPVSAARSKSSARDAREDAREKDPGRANPGGHLTQRPHCSPLCEHVDEKSCSVTSDCPFQISRMKQYGSAMSPGAKEKTSQDSGRTLAKSQEICLFPGSAKARLERTRIVKSFGASYFNKEPILHNLIKSMFCRMLFFSYFPPSLF